MMRYLLCIVVVFIFSEYKAQISVYDCAIATQSVTQTELNDDSDFYRQCILLDSSENHVFNTTDSNRVTALSEIHIRKNFHAGQYDNGKGMHLRIAERELLDVFSMNQNDLSAVPQFGKFELGLDLPSKIDQRVNDYFNEVDDPNKLNPFNPEDIDIKAEFYFILNGQEYGPLTTYGFYYEEFSRNNTTQTWDSISTDQNYRIRFAPRALGNWKCKITVSIDEVVTYEPSEFYFQVVYAGNKDFTRVGNNNHYFEIGQEGYFPVGNNLPSPGIEATIRNIETRTPFDYEYYYKTVRELANSGANYYRMLTSPWNYEIEFEELGNYKDRMSNAWEMDRLLDLNKAIEDSTGKPFRMHWNMQIHFNLEKVAYYAIREWDWASNADGLVTPNCQIPIDNGYCYNEVV